MNWISVRDKTPEREKDVLLFDGQEMIVGAFNGLDFCENYSDYDIMVFATHWMPLPEPPEAT